MLKKLFIAGLFFVSFQLFANISEIDVTRLSTASIVKTITVEDGFEPKFIIYKYRDKGPELSVEVKSNRVNIAWDTYSDEKWQEQNESNFALANELLTNLIGENSFIAMMKDGKTIEDSLTNWSISGSAIGNMYLITLTEN